MKTRLIGLIGMVSLATTGCLVPSSPSSTNNLNAEPTASPTVSIPNTAKAVKVVFKTDATTGSFTSSIPANGTVPGEGAGFTATQFFDPSGTKLTKIPAWFQGLEIGLSGGDNTGATAAACARFTLDTEDDNDNCDLDGDGTYDAKCNGTIGYFRISEADCASASTGNGRATDPIYIRAYFSRSTSNLAASENIMVVIEYAATSYHSTSQFSNPTTCFDATGFNPNACSNFVWNAYLRNADANLTANPKPYFLFMPPTNNSLAVGKAGGSVATKQIILPLAADSNLKIFQLSRIFSALNSVALPDGDGAADGDMTEDDYETFSARCGSNSPLCAGAVIYSMTFYRI